MDVARVAGEVAGEAGRIDMPLVATGRTGRSRWSAASAGKSAITRLAGHGARGGDALELGLSPGGATSSVCICWRSATRSWAIHFYGDEAAADRMQLHASRIGFRHPDGGAWVEFAAAEPF